MPSFQTILRATVMAAVVAVVVKGWQLYGPTNEQVRSAVTQATDVARAILDRWKQQPKAVVEDPRLAVPRAQLLTPPVMPPSTAQATAPPLSPAAQPVAPKLLTDSGAARSVGPNQPPVAAASQAAPPAGSTAKDHMPELMSRLAQLGAADTNMTPWGDGGQMYRFSCRAPLTNAPIMMQHFESVAAEPTKAVEQVVVKLEAWRGAQRDGGTLRY